MLDEFDPTAIVLVTVVILCAAVVIWLIFR